MKGILTDHNMEGQAKLLLQLLTSDDWRDLWEPLQLLLFTFADFQLANSAPDDVLWFTCQQEEVVLITANRNHDGPTSLEAVIRENNTSNSLPIFTVSDATKIITSKTYAENTAAKMLEFLMEIENYRGTGRLYLP